MTNFMNSIDKNNVRFLLHKLINKTISVYTSHDCLFFYFIEPTEPTTP